MKRITKIGILQAAKIVAVLYLIGSVVFFIPLAIAAFIAQTNPSFMEAMEKADLPTRPFLLIMMPVIYACIGFVLSAIGCFLFNLVAPRLGGITLEIEDDAK